VANPDFAIHEALVANAVTTVVLNNGQNVKVINRTGTDEIYFNVGKNDSGNDQQVPADPTVGGDDCYVVPAVMGASEKIEFGPGPVTVQLISASIQSFSVITGNLP
jgi:hypothetical protein